MKTIVIGAGYWGTNYIKELGDKLVGVVELDKERVDFIKERYTQNVWSELPEHIRYDAAIVCTPPDTHVELALPLLETGHNVLIEKPMSHDMTSAFKLKKYEKQIMVGHIYLYHPSIVELKERLQEKQVNHIFSRRTNDGPVRPWQNAAWDLAPHDISIFNYFAGGSPTMVSATGSRNWAMIRMEYPGLDTVAYVSWCGGPKVRQIELAYNSGDRYVFDDVATVLEVSPMRLMLDDFMSGDWDDRCRYDNGLEVIRLLSQMGRLF